MHWKYYRDHVYRILWSRNKSWWVKKITQKCFIFFERNPRDSLFRNTIWWFRAKTCTQPRIFRIFPDFRQIPDQKFRTSAQPIFLKIEIRFGIDLKRSFLQYIGQIRRLGCPPAPTFREDFAKIPKRPSAPPHYCSMQRVNKGSRRTRVQIWSNLTETDRIFINTGQESF